MIYREPEMEIIEISDVLTIVDASQFDNGGGGISPPDPEVDLFYSSLGE